MRWILPGGTTLGGSNRKRDEREVACRLGAAVLESVRPKTFWERLVAAVKLLLGKFITFWKWFFSADGLTDSKLWWEVLAILVGLIGTILALFGWSWK